MITKDYDDEYAGPFYLYCDLCDYSGGAFNYFDEAVDYKKENGWKSKKDKVKGWQDVCPKCAKEGER